jgi:hypothetical protein
MNADALPGESVTTEAERGRDRRVHRRFPINAPAQYRIKDGAGEYGETGSGRTLNISSGGVLFESNNPLRLGALVELAIAWPVLLDTSTGLTLWLVGKVVRVEQNRSALAIVRYEFRTRAVPKDIRRETQIESPRRKPGFSF